MWNLIIPAVTSILEKIIPDPKTAADAKYKLIEMMQSGELAHLDADVKLAVQQMEVNKIEAGTDMFRGGWRPFCGWICGVGLLYTFIIRPLLPWIVSLFGVQVAVLPDTDMNTLMGILGGMLGLGTLRTVERIKGKV